MMKKNSNASVSKESKCIKFPTYKISQFFNQPGKHAAIETCFTVITLPLPCKFYCVVYQNL